MRGASDNPNPNPTPKVPGLGLSPNLGQWCERGGGIG